MTDKEMLEAAAKAAGISTVAWGMQFDQIGWFCNPTGEHWNPLADDGDALRLAVKLGLRVQCVELDRANVDDGDDESPLTWQAVTTKFDPYAATRRAIVRAAAAMAKA